MARHWRYLYEIQAFVIITCGRRNNLHRKVVVSIVERRCSIIGLQELLLVAFRSTRSLLLLLNRVPPNRNRRRLNLRLFPEHLLLLLLMHHRRPGRLPQLTLMMPRLSFHLSLLTFVDLRRVRQALILPLFINLFDIERRSFTLRLGAHDFSLFLVTLYGDLTASLLAIVENLIELFDKLPLHLV